MFSSLEPSILQLSFEVLALAGRGLFFAELIRNRANKAAEDLMAPREGRLARAPIAACLPEPAFDEAI